MLDTVVVLGSGTMGRGIAQVAATSGLTAFLYDSIPGQLRSAVAEIKKGVEKAVEKGALKPDQAAGVSDHLVVCEALDAVQWKRVDVVVEAIIEKVDAKTELYRRVQPMLRPDTILATNTSSISITKLAAATDRPARFIGMHFFNPVPRMKLVEVIRGLATDDVTCQTVETLAGKMGKTPVRCNDMPGFVSNRVLMPMINEAAFALMEGVAPEKNIDDIMMLGCNFPMGPLALADLIGLDVCVDILEVLHRDLGDPKFRPCPLLKKLVAAGRLGKKSGRGFYDYTAKT